MATRTVPKAPVPSVSIDHLLTYAVALVKEKGEECTFERLVCECFTLFPQHFGMQRYTQWPDSLRVNKSWWRCRSHHGWLIGSVQEGFHLTDQGAKVASRVAQLVAQDPTLPKRMYEGGRSRDRYQSMLRHVRRTTAFMDYSAAPDSFSPTDSALRQLLNATMETPLRILKQNMLAYRQAAEAHNDSEVLAFLAACDEALASGTAKEN